MKHPHRTRQQWVGMLSRRRHGIGVERSGRSVATRRSGMHGTEEESATLCESRMHLRWRYVIVWASIVHRDALDSGSCHAWAVHMLGKCDIDRAHMKGVAILGLRRTTTGFVYIRQTSRGARKSTSPRCPCQGRSHCRWRKEVSMHLARCCGLLLCTQAAVCTHLRIIKSFLYMETMRSLERSMNLYSSAVSLPSASGA